MLKYIASVLEPRVSQFRDAIGTIMPTLLIMDAHGAHLTSDVNLALRSLNIDVLMIPSKNLFLISLVFVRVIYARVSKLFFVL